MLLAKSPTAGTWRYLTSIFLKCALLEMFDGAGNLNPTVFRLLKDRYVGGRKIRVSQRADGYADQRWHNVSLPIDCRAAGRTEIRVDLLAACPMTDELFRGARNVDRFDQKKGTYTEWRARSSLAIQTMAGDHQFRRPS